jgi:hypothetical protein
VLVGNKVGLGEQAPESTDEMPSVDKRCRNSLRSSMVYSFLWCFDSGIRSARYGPYPSEPLARNF